MNRSFTYIFLSSTLVGFIFPTFTIAQTASDQRRETYYQNLEARARSLSQKLAEISGTDPIPFQEPQRSVLSTMEAAPQNTTPQTAYDSLPGPVIQADPPKSAVEGETLYRADGTPVVLQTAPTTSPAIASPAGDKSKKRPIRRNMEKERGSYFIQPFLGVLLPPSEISFSGLPEPAEIEMSVGHSIGLSFGRRWDNLEGELHFGYASSAFSNLVSSLGPTTFKSDGQLDVFQIGTRIGYAIPFGQKGWFRTAGGFGFASRRDAVNIIDFNNRSYASSETAFTYDLMLGLGYEVGLGLDGFLAYRLLGVSENGNFDSVAMHLFQVGLGANF